MAHGLNGKRRQVWSVKPGIEGLVLEGQLAADRVAYLDRHGSPPGGLLRSLAQVPLGLHGHDLLDRVRVVPES
jgi:hypothetical protein